MTKKSNKRGAPKRKFPIVTHSGEYFHFDRRNIERIPIGLKGIYVLHDYRKVPVYVGEAGEHKRGHLRGRLLGHLRDRRFHGVIRTFSVYGMEREHIQDVEAILLRSFKSTLIFNKAKGGYYKAERLKKPKGRPPSRSQIAKKPFTTGHFPVQGRKNLGSADHG